MAARTKKRPTARTLLARLILFLLIVCFLFFLPNMIRRVQKWFAKDDPVVVDPAEEDEPKHPLHVITEAEIQETVVTACRETGYFVVSEQDTSTTVELTKSFANWGIFTKTKKYRCFGTGAYTVDLSQIRAEDVKANIAGGIVRISIPRAQLYSVDPDYDKTEFEDTEHGWLAFGEIKLTVEQQNEINKDVDRSIQEKLNSDVCLNRANTAALSACKDLFTRVIHTVDPQYVVVVKFIDEP